MSRVKILSAADVPDSVFEFRYAIYVDEMHRPQKYACNKTRTIRDPLDESAVHVVAYDGDDIVGTLRYNHLSYGPVDEYEQLYGLHNLTENARLRSSLSTRFMVSPSVRSSLVPLQMMKAISRYSAGLATPYNFIDCNAHLIEFFERFGYRKIADRLHSEYGHVSIMRVDGFDEKYLRRIRSPFLAEWRKLPADLRRQYTKLSNDLRSEMDEFDRLCAVDHRMVAAE
ncbi:MAG: GNAT family N-acyltransferase [Pseudomonadota bacterium]